MGETVRGISWAAPAGLAPTGAEVGPSNSGLWLSSQGQDFELLQPGAPTFQMLSGEDMLPWGVLCSLHSSTRPPTTTRASPSSRLRGAHSLCPPCPSWPCPHPGTLTQATPVCLSPQVLRHNLQPGVPLPPCCVSDVLPHPCTSMPQSPIL